MIKIDKLNIPPLENVQCDISFGSDNNEWQNIYEGLFFTKIKEDFPIVSKGRTLDITLDGNKQIVRERESSVFKNESDTKNLNVFPNKFSLTTEEYDEWSSYVEKLDTLVEAFMQYTKRDYISGFFISYLNIIKGDYLKDISKIKDDFNYFPTINYDLKGDIQVLIQKFATLLDDSNFIFEVDFNSVNTMDKDPALALRLTYRTNKLFKYNKEEFFDNINKAHLVISENFQSIIADKIINRLK